MAGTAMHVGVLYTREGTHPITGEPDDRVQVHLDPSQCAMALAAYRSVYGQSVVRALGARVFPEIELPPVLELCSPNMIELMLLFLGDHHRDYLLWHERRAWRARKRRQQQQQQQSSRRRRGTERTRTTRATKGEAESSSRRSAGAAPAEAKEDTTPNDTTKNNATITTPSSPTQTRQRRSRPVSTPRPKPQASVAQIRRERSMIHKGTLRVRDMLELRGHWDVHAALMQDIGVSADIEKAFVRDQVRPAFLELIAWYLVYGVCPFESAVHPAHGSRQGGQNHTSQSRDSEPGALRGKVPRLRVPPIDSGRIVLLYDPDTWEREYVFIPFETSDGTRVPATGSAGASARPNAKRTDARHVYVFAPEADKAPDRFGNLHSIMVDCARIIERIDLLHTCFVAGECINSVPVPLQAFNAQTAQTLANMGAGVTDASGAAAPQTINSRHDMLTMRLESVQAMVDTFYSADDVEHGGVDERVRRAAAFQQMAQRAGFTSGAGELVNGVGAGAVGARVHVCTPHDIAARNIDWMRNSLFRLGAHAQIVPPIQAHPSGHILDGISFNMTLLRMVVGLGDQLLHMGHLTESHGTRTHHAADVQSEAAQNLTDVARYRELGSRLLGHVLATLYGDLWRHAMSKWERKHAEAQSRASDAEDVRGVGPGVLLTHLWTHMTSQAVKFTSPFDKDDEEIAHGNLPGQTPAGGAQKQPAQSGQPSKQKRESQPAAAAAKRSKARASGTRKDDNTPKRTKRAQGTGRTKRRAKRTERSSPAPTSEDDERSSSGSSGSDTDTDTSSDDSSSRSSASESERSSASESESESSPSSSSSSDKESGSSASDTKARTRKRGRKRSARRT